MGVYENNKCLSIHGGIISTYSQGDKGISHEEELELVKKVAIIIRDYKITVSFESIVKTNILATLNEAIKNNVITKRTDKDGYVGYDFDKKVLRFKKNPKLFDSAIIKAKNNKGLGVVEVLKLIKTNYNNKEFINSLYDYYNNKCGQSFYQKYSMGIGDLKELISDLFNMDEDKAKKLIYAMKYNGNYDITVKRSVKTYKGRYIGSYISGAYIYLGSVK